MNAPMRQPFQPCTFSPAEVNRTYRRTLGGSFSAPPCAKAHNDPRSRLARSEKAVERKKKLHFFYSTVFVLVSTTFENNPFSKKDERRKRLQVCVLMIRGFKKMAMEG
ncbi:hypothetical protein CEXT_754381 [Caerostris extrusa]|uniref:Uncharacterized protein n=1 Tax=Caerostris extrusa TaxID=172846 RepID=A0AAV4Y7Z6_CAEEX|nr:hypothetical protein CEXT_754381 [Caerostris extrusa]